MEFDLAPLLPLVGIRNVASAILTLPVHVGSATEGDRLDVWVADLEGESAVRSRRVRWNAA
jgi:hypothetical protein